MVLTQGHPKSVRNRQKKMFASLKEGRMNELMNSKTRIDFGPELRRPSRNLIDARESSISGCGE
jgi:hypothetical protein